MNKQNNNVNGKKILFANFPGDGHFNPLTGLSVHLKNAGYDVRWYTGSHYAPKLEKLQIPHYPFVKAMEFTADNIKDVFPDREKAVSQIAKLKFDIINVFIKRGPEYYEDIKNIRDEFPFDLMIADCCFTGMPFVKHLLQVPIIAIGVVPLTETSKDLAPAGLGVEPSYSFFGKIKMRLLRIVAKHIIFKQPDKELHQLLDNYHIPHNSESVFDILIKNSDLFLQSGSPSFEYKRSDMSRHIKFIGALLPHTTKKKNNSWFDERLNQYKNVVLVTQGTVEKDGRKILVPTLEAFKNTDTLVVCTTGGSQTAMLKEKYPQQNIIIEDFIAFDDVMPYTDVYITNGGYGGVMLGIENKLPMVVAGVHEGKNEICARIGYFKYGINLKTETPLPS
ncbi:MAG: glycosyltransferase, partial [Bacteroidota bacterium]